MQFQDTEIIPNLKIVDDKYFNVENLSDYDLQMSYSSFGFDIAVIDSRNHKCLYVEENTWDEFSFPAESIESLEQLFDNHHFLKAGFWKSITLSVKNEKFTLIPSSLFLTACAKDYLEFNCYVTVGEKVAHHEHPSLGFVSVFAYPTHIVQWIKSQYPNKKIQLVHHTSAFMEGVLRENHAEEDPQIFAMAESGLLTVMVARGSELLFCNNFATKTNEDILYFLLFVLDQLRLNKSKTQITLWGDFSEQGPLMELLIRYIRSLELGIRPSLNFYSYVFDEMEDHRKFDLLSMKLCS